MRLPTLTPAVRRDGSSQPMPTESDRLAIWLNCLAAVATCSTLRVRNYRQRRRLSCNERMVQLS